jgi:hypothetical protein
MRPRFAQASAVPDSAPIRRTGKLGGSNSRSHSSSAVTILRANSTKSRQTSKPVFRRKQPPSAPSETGLLIHPAHHPFGEDRGQRGSAVPSAHFAPWRLPAFLSRSLGRNRKPAAASAHPAVTEANTRSVPDRRPERNREEVEMISRASILLRENLWCITEDTESPHLPAYMQAESCGDN